MSPTYVDGQILLVRRMNTLGRKLRDGDVILVSNDHDVIIKRVFRLPGEEIDRSFPDVLSPTERRDLTDYYEQKVVRKTAGDETHYYVPTGYLVVVGDNTTNSEDSRVFGPVSINDVLGVVVQSPPAPYASGSSATDTILSSHPTGTSAGPADGGQFGPPAPDGATRNPGAEPPPGVTRP